MGIENIQIIETVPLDFYNNNIQIINVKQLDTSARGIRVNCTEHGKKFKLNTLSHSAFVRYKKPDGKDIFNKCYIQDDGCVIFELTQQMTAVAGKSKLDILIFCTPDLTIEDIEDISNFNGLGITTLSTMILELNIHPNATDLQNVESYYEYNAINEGFSKMVAIMQLENTVRENETQRQADELNRQNAESNRTIAENKRQKDTQNAINDCEEAIRNVNTAIENTENIIKVAQTATENANVATTSANEATVQAINASENANTAAQETRNIINNGGIVLKTDIVHNLETEDETKVPDANQVKILNDLIADLQAQLNAMPKVYFGTEEPDPSIGKDGDIYMKLLPDETVGE